MSKTTITRAEYLQLLGMKKMADTYTAQIQELIKAGQTISGEGDSYGHIADAFWADSNTLSEALRKLHITVLPDPPVTPVTQGWEIEPIVVNDEQGYLLVRGTGENREELPLPLKTKDLMEALLRAQAPSVPPEDLNERQ